MRTYFSNNFPKLNFRIELLLQILAHLGKLSTAVNYEIKSAASHIEFKHVTNKTKFVKIRQFNAVDP